MSETEKTSGGPGGMRIRAGQSRTAAVTFIVCGILVLANAMISTFNASPHSGTWLMIAIGAALILSGVFHRLYLRIPEWLRLIFVCACVTALAAVLLLFIYGSSDNAAYTEDAVIVLGAGVRGDVPSRSLRSRLDAALDYHKRNPDAVIVVSGGQGAGEDISEAEAMFRYLTEHGVPEFSILREDRSTSTSENFAFSKAILDAHFGKGKYTAAFITNDYHVFRAEFLARSAGLDGSQIRRAHAATYPFVALPNGLRECLAIVRQYVMR